MSKERESKFELMRIISMFLIIVYHVIVHGKVIENCQNEGLIIILELIKIATLVHVNSFVLVCGYYQYNSKFKHSKILGLLNSSIFYSAVIMIIFSILDFSSITKLTFFIKLFPLNLSEYWFIKLYIILYCFSPFLNILINKIDKKLYQKMLLVIFFVISILAYITGGEVIYNPEYQSLYNFIFFYLVGAYISKYPIEKSYIFKNMSINLFRLFLIFVFIFSTILIEIIFRYGIAINGINSITTELSRIISMASFAYGSPLVVLQTICYCTFFSTLNIKSKIINKISSLVFGIYIIHDNFYIRSKIYFWLKINNGPIYSYKFLMYMLIISLFIFVFCAIIDLIKQSIFKFIYNLSISNKIRKKYFNYINSIHFN